MTDLTIWDHLFVLFVFIAYPTYAKLTFKKSIKHIIAGGETARVKAYQGVIATWIIFAIFVLLLWHFLGRDWAAIGFRWGELDRTLIALAAAAAVTALFVVPIRKTAIDPDNDVGKFKAQIGDFFAFMPATNREVGWFKAVSLNAGLQEELIYRGFLIWYLTQFVSLPWAAVLSAIAFTLAHAYQGLKQLPGILFVATVCVGLYVYTGSLLVPVIFHILLDALQGHYVGKMLSK